MRLAEQLDVLVVLGSLSDKPVAEQIKPILDELGLKSSFHVCSAHRDHERLVTLIPEAEQRGAKAVIAMAGKAAHLPGVCAALTSLPVIGVPVDSGLQGLDALLSIAQMPPGVPVACVGINGGRNAALLAAQIIATGETGELRAKLHTYRQQLQKKNRTDDAELQDALTHQ